MKITVLAVQEIMRVWTVYCILKWFLWAGKITGFEKVVNARIANPPSGWEILQIRMDIMFILVLKNLQIVLKSKKQNRNETNIFFIIHL